MGHVMNYDGLSELSVWIALFIGIDDGNMLQKGGRRGHGMSLFSLPRRFFCRRYVTFLLDVPNLPCLFSSLSFRSEGLTLGVLSSSSWLVQLPVLPTSLLAGPFVVCSADVLAMCLFPSCS